MNLFEDKLDETIGILICNDYNTDYEYPEDFFMAIINLFMYHYYDESSQKYMDNTIYVKKNMLPNVSMFNFDLDNKVKLKLYKCGIKSAKEFIKKNKNKIN